MAWTGYLALGNVSTSGIFTELSGNGYARQAFQFAPPMNGKMQGSGANIVFPTATAAWTYNAAAFFTGSSGGTSQLIYPLSRTLTTQPGGAHQINPYAVSVDIVHGFNAEGQPVDIGAIGQLAGTLPVVDESRAVDSLTAHAGGGQAAALQLSASINRITTVATAADSVKLPASTPGMHCYVINAAAANSMNVFPATGDKINALAANAAFAVAANKTAHFICATAGTWNCILTS